MNECMKKGKKARKKEGKKEEDNLNKKQTSLRVKNGNEFCILNI
jgi:hypothetical protein